MGERNAPCTTMRLDLVTGERARVTVTDFSQKRALAD